MAGTGHLYEILNVEAVHEVLAAHIEVISYSEGRAWFSSPTVLRFMTSSRFVTSVSSEVLQEMIPEAALSEPERAMLLRKAGEGGDIRIFVKPFFANLGPDLAHLADWVNALPDTDPLLVPKLRRVNFDAALRMSEHWSRAAARRRLSPEAVTLGDIEIICDSLGGRVWAELKDNDALVVEGYQMQHCVGSYGSRLRSGTRIFSLRDHTAQPLVTVDVSSHPYDPECLLAGQIRSRLNARLPAYLRDDVALLLNHLGVKQERAFETAASGLVLNDNGQWANLIACSEHVEIEGLPGLAVDNEVHVLSPFNPDRTIALVKGVKCWPEARERPLSIIGRPSVISTRDDLSNAEQRCVAKLANASWRTGGVGAPFLSLTAEGFKTWLDQCRPVVRGGRACLIDGRGAVHVVKDEDAAPLLTIVPTTPKLGINGFEATPPERPHQWSATEIRAIADVLNDFAGVVFRDKETRQSLTNAGLVQTSLGWARYQDHVTFTESPVIGPHGHYVWARTPWSLSLLPLSKKQEAHTAHPVVTIFLDDTGRVFEISHHRSGGLLDDVPRALHELGILPADGFCVDRSFSGFRKGTPIVYPVLVYVDGRWTFIQDQGHAEQIATSCLDGPDSPSFCSLIVALCEHRVMNLDVGARYLPAWLERHMAAMADGVFTLVTTETLTRRLALAAEVLDIMKPRDAALCVRLASRVMRTVMGRTRRPRPSSGDDIIRDLLRSYGARLPAKLMARAADWSLQGHPYAMKASEPELGWTELYDALPDGAGRRIIQRFLAECVHCVGIGLLVNKNIDEHPAINMGVDAATTWLSYCDRCPPSSLRHVQEGVGVLAAVAAAHQSEDERWQTIRYRFEGHLNQMRAYDKDRQAQQDAWRSKLAA